VSARRRWLRFNLVGVMGFAVQTMTLWLLVRWAGASAGMAVTIAVLAAVSHNFAWHERFTWRGLPRQHRLKRWLSFHVSTGTVSVLTNVGITMAVMNVTGLSVLPANIIAVVTGSLASFWINDRLVFRPAPALEKSADARVSGTLT
jgi:putative flippase GtrA